MKTKVLSSVLALGVIFASCKKDKDKDNVNPNTTGGSKQTEMGFQLKVENQQSNVAQKTTATPVINWTSGTANPKRIKFEAKKDNSKIEYTTWNTGPIDLMSLDTTTFGNFTIPPGTYDEIELKIDLEDDHTTPALELAGQVTIDSATLPLSLIIEDRIQVKTEQEDVTITDGNLFTAITTLDLASFIDGIKLDMIANAKLSNGVIVISRDSNRALYWIIVKNLSDRHHHCHFKHRWK